MKKLIQKKYNGHKNFSSNFQSPIVFLCRFLSWSAWKVFFLWRYLYGKSGLQDISVLLLHTFSFTSISCYNWNEKGEATFLVYLPLLFNKFRIQFNSGEDATLSNNLAQLKRLRQLPHWLSRKPCYLYKEIDSNERGGPEVPFFLSP